MKRLKKILRWGAVALGCIIAVLLVVWAVLNAIWGAELRKTIAEIKARGEPMTIAEIIPPYVPPEQNAAVELNKVFALMCGDKPDEQYIPNKQPGKLKASVQALNDFRPKMKQASTEEIKKNFNLIDSPELANIFAALDAAALKSECNFDLRYEDGVAMLLPNLGICRASVRLLCLKALARANKENIAGASDILMTAVKVSNHFQNEPIIISQLVRMSGLEMTAEALNNIADDFQLPEENAKNLIAELEKSNTTEPLKKAFIGERVCFGQLFLNESISGKNGYIHAIGFRQIYFIWWPFIKRDYCEYLRIMPLYSKACDKPFYLSKKEIKNIETFFDRFEAIPRYRLFPSLLPLVLPHLTSTLERNAEFQTKLAISKIKLALNIYKGKHAAFPENLEQLKPDILQNIPIDELTGNPLTYKKEGGKYVLFSVAVQKREEERERKQEANQKKAAGK